MTQYYFLATALPALHFGAPAELSFEDLDILLRENLTPQDLEKEKVLRRYYDILNIRFFWKEQTLEPYGNWDEKEIEEKILDRVNVPNYLDEFLDRYKDKQERLNHFPELIGAYFRNEINNQDGFVKDYLEFERKLRLVLVALRAKKLNRDLMQEMQFEDPQDPLVAQILAHKDAADYDPPEQFFEVKQIFQDYTDDPLELHKALYQYRFDVINELVGVETFSINRILGYMMRLIMVLKWLELDRQQGIQKVDAMIEEAK